MIINFLGTVEMYAPKHREVLLFAEYVSNREFRFLRLTRPNETLVYFLYVRAVIARLLRKEFYHRTYCHKHHSSVKTADGSHKDTIVCEIDL